VGKLVSCRKSGKKPDFFLRTWFLVCQPRIVIKIRKLFSRFLALVCIIVAASGCGAGSSTIPTLPPPTQTPPPAQASGASYYVDSVNGQDSNSGLSSSQAWQTLAPVNDHSFEPGDTIHFACGSNWDAGLILRDSGTAGQPITLTAYGSGHPPVFEKPGGIAIWITGSYTVIDGLFLQNAANDPDIPYNFRGALLIYTGTEHNVVRNSEFTNAGVGIKTFGRHHLIEHNYIHDLVLVYDRPKESYGAIGISVNDSDTEIAHNGFENCRHEAIAYGYDGGAIEIEGFTAVKDNIYIHHNVSIGSQGFIEVAETKATNVTVAHNVSDDYQQFIAWDTTTRPSNFLVEHNTVIRIHPENACALFTMFYYREEGVDPDESWLTFRNNVFYTAWRPVLDNADYPCNYPHGHNLFYTPSGSAISDPVGYPLGPGDIIGDPQFVDFGARDLHLQPTSPAIDMGADLGYTNDYDANPVPIGPAPDAGAYEYQN
jgi:hypothetical protein